MQFASQCCLGRINCETLNEKCVNSTRDEVECIATAGPHRELPSPDITTHELFAYFENNFGFNMQQTVALMGGHSLGTLSRENSGFDGRQGWVQNNNHLSNDYYNQIVGGTPEDANTTNIDVLARAPQWTQTFVDNSYDPTFRGPDRFQWERNIRRGGPIVMLNSDIAITRDLTGHLDPTTGEATCAFRGGNNNNAPQNMCPIAEASLLLAAQYKFNNTKFLIDFSNVYNEVLVQGYAKSTCATLPCTLIN
jgi:hypothetical protein